MLKVIPFLLFDGNCVEAMEFYHKCLGGEVTLTRLGDTPMKDMFPREKWNRLINAHLKSGAVEISAADWMASPDLEPVLGNRSAIFVVSDQNDELQSVFERLGDGAHAEHFQALHEQPFGLYGQFFDRYGVQWIFRGENKR